MDQLYWKCIVEYNTEYMFYTFCFQCANWHPPTTLTEVFPRFFPQLQGKCQGTPCKDGAWSALFLISGLCCSMYCLCVNVYCTTATRWQPNCS